MTCIQSWPKIKNVHVHVLNVKVICEKKAEISWKRIIFISLGLSDNQKRIIKNLWALKINCAGKVKLKF